MSSDRLVELLLKGVRALPDAERDEVLAALLGGAVGSPVGGAVGGTLRPDPQLLRSRVISGGWIRPLQRSTPPPGLAGMLSGSGAPDVELRVLPVRLPAADYERLRAFSREHGFSMAVIIRTLVERFLDGQARRWARSPDGTDDEDLDEPTTAGLA